METTEGNKLIAEFMGYQILRKKFETQRMCSSNETTWVMDEDDIVCDAKGNEVDDERQEPYFDLEMLPFNSSWDWLMPVVEKIESLTYGTLKLYNHVNVRRFKHVNYYWVVDGVADYGDGKQTITAITFPHGDNKDIDALYNTVVKFIEWYNEKNK